MTLSVTAKSWPFAAPLTVFMKRPVAFRLMVPPVKETALELKPLMALSVTLPALTAVFP